MLSSICIILLGAAGVYSFPTGAPITLCNDPFPGHGAQASTTESPYTISVSDSQYQPDQIINITISADADDIRGFSIGVHSVSGAWERLYGEFTSTPDNTVSYQYYSMESNCVTHGQNYTRMNSISFQWKAPNVSVGDLTISATIVKNFNTFWLNQTVSLTAAQSAENGAVTPARMITSGAANLDSDLSLEMCGNKSGCMTRPKGCAGDDCEVVLSHKSVSGGVRFRLTLRQDDMTSSFVALGISEDQSMPDDETVSCLDFAGRYAVNQGFNPARFNVKAQSEEISDVVTHTVDGALTCEFTRRLQSSFTYYGLAGPAVYDVDYTPSLNTPNYYLYVAWGKPYAGTREAAGMHSTLPEISKNKVAFSSKSRMLFKSQDLDEDTTISSTTTDSGAAANVMSFVMVAALGVVRVL